MGVVRASIELEAAELVGLDKVPQTWWLQWWKFLVSQGWRPEVLGQGACRVCLCGGLCGRICSMPLSEVLVFSQKTSLAFLGFSILL